MPKRYEQMNKQERIREYDRLSGVLKKQKAEKPQRADAIQITVGRMQWLTRLHNADN